ncbi:hypothetical protein BC828DRAFT_387109 [Blastocladiella britannica]|nr:hypothetical protein BC828DRAFT_387109 [Blastocladiella britannica]
MAGTDPRECLLTKATSLHADVIVLGARSGRGQVARLLLGSTSDFLARNAPCPVVIVREPADDAGLARAHAKGGKVIATPTETVGQPLPFPARESGSKD